jgi:hypothetical protein
MNFQDEMDRRGVGECSRRDGEVAVNLPVECADPGCEAVGEKVGENVGSGVAGDLSTVGDVECMQISLSLTTKTWRNVGV